MHTIPHSVLTWTAAGALALMLAAPAAAQQQPVAEDPPTPSEQDPENPDLEGEQPETIPATFIDSDGNEVGSAAIREVPAGGVLFDINIGGLPAERWLGFHVHEGAECNPEDGFDSAGSHFNPEGADHGYFVESGPHAGDMPNQFVPESGLLRAVVYNHMVSLEGDMGIRGRTLMIHDEADDYESQPSGDAGGRIACAVIE